MATAQRTIPVLIKTAKALQAKAEACEEKAEQFYISLGLTLAELKERKPKGTTWPAFVKKHFNYSQTRADQLIRIGNGKTNVAEVRAINAKRMKDYEERKKSASADAGSKPISEKAKARGEKAEAWAKEEQEKAVKKHLQDHDRQVADYTDTMKIYVVAIREAILCAERFSAPETVRFVSRKHDEIQKLQSEFEEVLSKQVAKAAA